MMGIQGANLGDLKMMFANATMDGRDTMVLTAPKTTPLVSHADS